MLKKMIAGLLALAFVLPSFAEAAKKPAKKAAKEVRDSVEKQGDIPGMGVFITAGPGSYGIPINAGFEMAVGDLNTWDASAGVSFWGDPSSTYPISYTFINLSGGFKWWIGSYLPGAKSRAMQGIFVGPTLKYSMVTVSYTYNVPTTTITATPPYYTTTNNKKTDYYSANLFGGGAQGGYQWMFPNNFYAAGLLDVGFLVGGMSAGAYTFPIGGTYYNVLLKGGYAF